MSPTPSRFLSEIPIERVEEIRTRNNTFSAGYAPMAPKHTMTSNETGFFPGEQVHHQKFGQGTVIDTEGSDKNSRIQVNFKHAGSKWLVLAYAKLEKI